MNHEILPVFSFSSAQLAAKTTTISQVLSFANVTGRPGFGGVFVAFSKAAGAIFAPARVELAGMDLLWSKLQFPLPVINERCPMRCRNRTNARRSVDLLENPLLGRVGHPRRPVVTEP